MGIWYTTREEVRASLEVNFTSRSDSLIDRKIEAASRSAEALLHRTFYPSQRTQSFDWPNYQYSPAWRLWLGKHELISASSVVAGGVTIASSDYLLRPYDGPPFTHIEVDLSSAAAFQSGSTHQDAILITGVFGYQNNELLGGELAGNISNSITTIDIKPLNSALLVGVGSLIKIGTERMTVTDRIMIDTTQNLQTDLTASKSNVTVAVTTGSAFGINEIILLDSERMRIVDIAGNNLTVERAYGGTVLATHSGSDIYAARRYTVTRGVLGTTAATHSTDDDVYVFEYPGLVSELTLAESVVMLEQNAAAYARVVGTGLTARESSGQGLIDLRELARKAHGRLSRKEAI